jgi:hypothetical protein
MSIRLAGYAHSLEVFTNILAVQELFEQNASTLRQRIQSRSATLLNPPAYLVALCDGGHIICIKGEHHTSP